MVGDLVLKVGRAMVNGKETWRTDVLWWKGKCFVLLTNVAFMSVTRVLWTNFNANPRVGLFIL